MFNCINFKRKFLETLIMSSCALIMAATGALAMDNSLMDIDPIRTGKQSHTNTSLIGLLICIFVF